MKDILIYIAKCKNILYAFFKKKEYQILDELDENDYKEAEEIS